MTLTTMTLREWERETVALSDAVESVDPFKGFLVGLRVSVYGPFGPRYGTITRHECYDTDTCLCVERITVLWDDGETERKSPRTWHGEACGPVGGPMNGTTRPAYLRAVKA